MTIGQEPTELAVGAGGGLFGHFYSHLSYLSSFSLSLGDRPIQTEILPQRAVTFQNNQPTKPQLVHLCMDFKIIWHSCLFET